MGATFRHKESLQVALRAREDAVAHHDHPPDVLVELDQPQCRSLPLPRSVPPHAGVIVAVAPLNLGVVLTRTTSARLTG